MTDLAAVTWLRPRKQAANDVCTACRGTGYVSAYKHRAPNRRHNVKPQTYRRYQCPACNGLKLSA